jgi:hypothetical protein
VFCQATVELAGVEPKKGCGGGFSRCGITGSPSMLFSMSTILTWPHDADEVPLTDGLGAWVTSGSACTSLVRRQCFAALALSVGEPEVSCILVA